MSSGAATATGPRAALRIALMGPAAAGLALAAAFALSSAASAADPLVVRAGADEGTAAVQAYLPGAFTVEVGQPVTFVIGSDEPHSITFGEGPTDLDPAQWPVFGWPEPEVVPGDDGSPAPTDLGTANYAGGGLLNTGLLPVGATATVVFDEPGAYTFQSVTHPGMTGTATVVEQGEAPVTTQAEADAAGAATLEDLLGRADAVRTDRLADVESITNSTGATTWNVFADAATVPIEMPGGGTGYLELLEFVPADLTIAPGDTVHWSARGIHTVTFPATGQDPATLDPFGPATTDEEYDGSRLASSGVLNQSPGSPSAFTLTFPTAGTFEYVCLLHAGAGQVGTVTVGEPAPSAG